MAVTDRLKSAWNAFRNVSEPTPDEYTGMGPTYSVPPMRSNRLVLNDRTVVTSVYNRISMDVAQISIRHVLVDEKDRFQETASSALQRALTVEPNLDQSPFAFKQDIVSTLFTNGVAAVVPVDTTRDPQSNEMFDIFTLRVGEILAWYPRHVRMNLYNERTGKREEVTLEKRSVAIIENPLYAVMNEPNSTLQRLIEKLRLMDDSDAWNSGKLDMIIQLPYVVKSEARRQQAEARRLDIESQLKGSQYGIAYTDGAEKITQLNRPTENNLQGRIEYLVKLLYSQLGITQEVMDGTADEKTMLNYMNRTVKPVVTSITEGMNRAFLGSPTVRKREQIMSFRDPFQLVPVGELAEIADKFTRNEILTSNEIRGFIGVEPSTDPKADELVNSNMPQSEPTTEPAPEPREESQNGV